MIPLEDIREYCLMKQMVTEDMPFGEGTLCFRIAEKIFLLTDINSNPLRINLKCDPEKAVELREQYENVKPGFHMNKKHWNTIILDNNIKISLVKDWIDHSFEMVKASLSKSEREKLVIEK